MQDVLSQIVKSYELPPLLEQRVIRIASQGIQYHSLHSFDEMYAYVDRLIERIKERDEPKLARLDHPLRSDDDRTLSDIIADTRTPTDETTPAYQLAKTAFDSKLQLMFPLLSPAERKLMLSLLENPSHHYFREESFDDVTALKERLGVLAKIVKEDKRFLHPERPIVAVSLDPERPSVRWGSRDYGGNPAAYRDKHIKVYGAMSRTELEAFDPGLHGALVRSGQMDIIPRKKRIPRIIPTVSLEERRRVLLAYETTPSPEAVAKGTGLADIVVQQVLKSNGLGKGLSVHSAADIARILEAHALTHGNRYQACALVGLRVGSMAIRNIWRRNGL